MKNNKGVELGISTIVVLALAVVVLVVVAMYFLGGFSSTGESVKDVAGSADTGTNWEEKMGKAVDLWGKATGADCTVADECASGKCTGGLCE